MQTCPKANTRHDAQHNPPRCEVNEVLNCTSVLIKIKIDNFLTISWGPGAYRKAATKDIKAIIKSALFRIKEIEALKPRPRRIPKTLRVKMGLDKRVTLE